jgi:hypothetical protein
VRKSSEVFTYLRATCFTRQKPELLAQSFMGVMAAEEYRLLQLFLHTSGNWNEK